MRPAPTAGFRQAPGLAPAAARDPRAGSPPRTSRSPVELVAKLCHHCHTRSASGSARWRSYAQAMMGGERVEVVARKVRPELARQHDRAHHRRLEDDARALELRLQERVIEARVVRDHREPPIASSLRHAGDSAKAGAGASSPSAEPHGRAAFDERAPTSSTRVAVDLDDAVSAMRSGGWAKTVGSMSTKARRARRAMARLYRTNVRYALVRAEKSPEIADETREVLLRKARRGSMPACLAKPAPVARVAAAIRRSSSTRCRCTRWAGTGSRRQAYYAVGLAGIGIFRRTRRPLLAPKRAASRADARRTSPGRCRIVESPRRRTPDAVEDRREAVHEKWTTGRPARSAPATKAMTSSRYGA